MIDNPAPDRKASKPRKFSELEEVIVRPRRAVAGLERRDGAARFADGRALLLQDLHNPGLFADRAAFEILTGDRIEQPEALVRRNRKRLPIGSKRRIVMVGDRQREAILERREIDD